MIRQGPSAGFTLMEIIVALVAFGLLLAGLTQGVRYGYRAWGAQTHIVAERDQLDATDRVLRQLIGHIERVRQPDKTSVGGRVDRFDFVTLMPEAGLLATRRADVSLLVDQAHRLVLRWAPHRHETPFGKPPEETTTEILSGVKTLAFAYMGQPASGDDSEPAWQTKWTDFAPPHLVKVHLAFAEDDPRRWPDIVIATSRD